MTSPSATGSLEAREQRKLLGIDLRDSLGIDLRDSKAAEAGMVWKVGVAIALVAICPALAEELDQSTVAETLRQLDSMLPRPWCNAERLNPTERSICADRNLLRLDALLELVYGRTTARDDDAAQLVWLRSERDACGTDSICIARAYSARISQLDSETW
jgi:hypothetical protein